MADTAKTISEILAEFGQNISGQGFYCRPVSPSYANFITPQVLRDTIVSLQPKMGGLYVSSSAATTPAEAGTHLKAAGTTTATSEVGFDASTTNNRLVYTGTEDRHMHIASSVSWTSGGNNNVCSLGIYHYDASATSGSVLTSSILKRKIATGADVGSTALHTDIMMSTNDYLEIWVANDTNTDTITLNYGYLFALAVPITGS